MKTDIWQVFFYGKYSVLIFFKDSKIRRFSRGFPWVKSWSFERAFFRPEPERTRGSHPPSTCGSPDVSDHAVSLACTRLPGKNPRTPP